MIVTFGPNWFSRRQKLEPEQLDIVFGGRQHWEPADQEGRPDERWRAWLATYRDALRRAGFRFQLQFQIVPRRASRCTWCTAQGTRRASRS